MERAGGTAADAARRPTREGWLTPDAYGRRAV
jgi:hypothetical protein